MTTHYSRQQLPALSTTDSFSLSSLPSPSTYFAQDYPAFSPSSLYFPSPLTSVLVQEEPAYPQSDTSSGSTYPSDRESSPATSHLSTPHESPILAARDSFPLYVAGDGGNHFNGQIESAQYSQHQQLKQAYDLYPAQVSTNDYAGFPVLSSSAGPTFPQQPQYSSASPIAVPMLYHPVPQLGAPLQQQQQQQSYQEPRQIHQQQPYPQQFAPAPPSFLQAPTPTHQFVAVAPPTSFETAQGTYYFVPNANAPPSASVVTQKAHGHSHSVGSGGSPSWDGDDEDVKPLGCKSKKGGLGKAQVKRFVCPHLGCGRAFARNFNMQSHLKSHLGIRDFDCPHCTKKFSRRHDRARHCSAVHNAHIDESLDRDDEFEG